MRTRPFQKAVLAWYAEHARRLPWRTTRDPYRILVSEIMLQQTQVSRVEPVYRAFLRRFPRVRALANASPADVLTAWQGLGYNRRALNLQAAARAVVAEHSGRFPDQLTALKALPGIGDYTARALLAFAFEQDAAPVDTNIARVLARAVAGAPLQRTQAQVLADQVLPKGRAREWNNALMDFGSQICLARAPRCNECPVAKHCVWQQQDAAQREQDPAAAGALRARPQGRFAGSDRFHRGRLVDALRQGALDLQHLPQAAQLEDPDRLQRLVDGLVDDGLAEWHGQRLRLPTGAVSA